MGIEIKRVGPFRSIETTEFWELIGATKGRQNVVVQTYRERDGKNIGDALDGLNQIAGYYDAAWVVSGMDVSFREIEACVERKQSIKFGTFLDQVARSSQVASRLTALLSSWTPQGGSPLLSPHTSKGLVRTGR